MKLKKFVSVVLSTTMIITSVNVAFAGENNDFVITDEEYVTENKDINQDVTTSDSSIEVYATYTDTYEVEGGYIYFDADTGTITDADATVTNVVIPDIINNTSVTSIGYDAFYGCKSLTSITIPYSVTNIQQEDYGGHAFYFCSNLTNIEVDENNEYYASKDGVLFNKDMTNLISYPCNKVGAYEVPTGVTKIINAFEYCTGLTSITIPEGVTSIGSFQKCTNLTSIEIPNGVTSINGNLFNFCSNLLSVTIPESVSNISIYNDTEYSESSSAFFGCNSLISINVSENNQNYASHEGVLYDKNFTELLICPRGKSGNYEIPDGVTSIGFEAFYKCNNITSITMPNSITSIGARSFLECTNLVSVTMSENITSIGGAAFSCCSSLKSITLPEGITALIDGSFYFCSSLESITIPNSVTFIGSAVFQGCDNLTNIIIPNGVEYILSYAFADCSNLTSVTIPSSVEYIGYSWDGSIIPASVFDGCQALTVYCVQNSTSDNINSYPDGSTLVYMTDEELATLTFTTETTTEITTETTTETTTESTTETTTTKTENMTVAVEGGNILIDTKTGNLTGVSSSITNLVLSKVTDNTTLTGITAEALSGTNLTSITIPATVENIESGAEEYLKDTVIIAEEYSYAYNFALANNLTYEKLMLYTLGDADGNGELSAADAATVLQKVLNASYELPIEGEVVSIKTYVNVQGNEELTASDAACILQKVLNGSFAFPVE